MKRSTGPVAGLARASAAACALTVVALGAMLAAGQEPAAPAPAEAGAQPVRPLRLAVVDLDEALEQSEEWQDHQEQRARLMEAMRRTLNKYDHQIRILRNEYGDLPPGTDAAAEKLAEIETTVGEFRNVKDGFDEKLDAQRRESLSTMFNKVADLLQQYAEANDIDLVLRKKSLRVSSGRPTELGVTVATADVLYVGEQFDVTDAIVEELNARYPREIREK